MTGFPATTRLVSIPSSCWKPYREIWLHFSWNCTIPEKISQ